MMEKGTILEQLDFQKKLQMSKDFRDLHDEDDVEESEALKAQMELEIAQTQIKNKQLEMQLAYDRAIKSKFKQNKPVT